MQNLPGNTAAAIAQQQARAFIDAVKPRRDGRPIIALVASNDGTETLDFLLAHAILQRSGVADVHAVAPHRGRVRLYPVFNVEVSEDLASFDQINPAGSDYVIVPAMENDNQPEILEWLKQQAQRGARIISVCAGAVVTARAGLLDGRRFTTHWHYRDQILKPHPTAIYVPDQRYVVDGNIVTTTGITASLPTMLALIESIGGYEKAKQLATEYGVDTWTPAHNSSLFDLNARRGLNYVLNKAAFWRNEHWRVDVSDGMEDTALAFASDAWARTGHVSVAPCAAGPVKLRSGVVLDARPAASELHPLPLENTLKPMQQLDRTLDEIEKRFGPARREWVMLELEYAGSPQTNTY